MNPLSRFAADRPALAMWLTGIFSAIMIALVAVPSLVPSAVPFLHPLKVDTDPENMLSAREDVRVYHNAMKAEFGLSDLIVVGVVNTQSPDGVFTSETLANVLELTNFAKTIRWQAGERTEGVIAVDIIAPSTVDNIEQAGEGSVSFNWLMPEAPQTREEALAVRDRAARIPTLNETLISADGKALAIYIPITRKDASYRVANALRGKIAEFDDGSEWHITGLPVAQDQFGVEMFIQMAISAPAAMVLILILMWLFFRQWNLILSPMVVAMASVIGAMGLLVVTGNTVHIMSSMIPIFVMPIAVLDAVHILSDFYDRYGETRDRRKTIERVMHELWRPMLFTTLTTVAGFASLALTPIPPVRIFGIYVAIGVFLAWLFTITLIPAYIMLMSEKQLAKFGVPRAQDGDGHATGVLARLLHAIGRLSLARPRAIVIIMLAALVIAGYGITQIRINDNPVKWFGPGHDIRIADRALNDRFAGTYMAYLTLEPSAAAGAAIVEDIEGAMGVLGTPASRQVAALAADRGEGSDLLSGLVEFATDKGDAATTDEEWVQWDDVQLALDEVRQQAEIFKDPEILAYIENLQVHLGQSGLVGKSNALTDIVKTVHRDLFLGTEEAFRIPDSAAAVAQTLITYQNSHRPQDLFKMVTPDYRKANIWLQLKSGDNIDMNAVIDAVDAYLAANPAPVALEHNWFGLTYINVVWQDRMVWGMLNAFLGSFVIVLFLMVFLFRSFWWGLLAMGPLTVTIGVIYGVIGLIGKDYDMPVAVLSALSLGLAVDYSIHFIARSREIYKEHGNWPDTARAVFGEPARAIMRNVIVIGAGFLPLLLATLVPYQTVGIFISAILVLAGFTTLIVLPALITIFEPVFFRKASKGELHVKSS